MRAMCLTVLGLMEARTIRGCLWGHGRQQGAICRELLGPWVSRLLPPFESPTV